MKKSFIQLQAEGICTPVLPVGLCRYKDTMIKVEMKYGQNATRWRTSLKTKSKARGGALLGDRPVFVSLPVERHTWSNLNLTLKQVF